MRIGKQGNVRAPAHVSACWAAAQTRRTERFRSVRLSPRCGLLLPAPAGLSCVMTAQFWSALCNVLRFGFADAKDVVGVRFQKRLGHSRIFCSIPTPRGFCRRCRFASAIPQSPSASFRFPSVCRPTCESHLTQHRIFRRVLHKNQCRYRGEISASLLLI